MFDHGKNLKSFAYKGEAGKHISEILLNLDAQHMDDQHMPEAEAWIKKAVEADRRNNMRRHLTWDYARFTEIFPSPLNSTQAGWPYDSGMAGAGR